MAPETYIGLPNNVQKCVMMGVPILTPELIIDTVCRTFNLQKDVLISKSRKRPVAEARAIAIGLIERSECKISLKALGRLFGTRHHSTVIYNKDLFNDLYGVDKKFTEKVDMVKFLNE